MIEIIIMLTFDGFLWHVQPSKDETVLLSSQALYLFYFRSFQREHLNSTVS